MIEPTGYAIKCDHQDANGERCAWSFQADSLFGEDGLFRTMKRTGWQNSVKADGTQAVHNGKDYCPRHRRPR